MTPADLAKPGTEHAHQVALFQAVAEWRWQNKDSSEANIIRARDALEWLFAIPNGGDRHAAVASKIKAEGAKAGVYDLFLPCPISGLRLAPFNEKPQIKVHVEWHGLYIEMKKPERRNHKDGGLSTDQLRFKAFVGVKGYAHVVCYTWGEAFAALMTYLEVKQ